MKGSISSLATALLLSSYTFALETNKSSYTGLEIRDGTSVIRDLKGSTGWFLAGEGKENILVFSFEMQIEEYGADLPDNLGVFWAMPMASSSPSAREWDVGIFLHGTDEGTKTQMDIKFSGEFDLEVGATQTWIFSTVRENATFSYENNGPVTKIVDGITRPHWKLSENQSSISPKKWSLNFLRSDEEAQ